MTELGSTTRPTTPQPAGLGAAPSKGVIQRKCACRGRAGVQGECEECKKKGSSSLELYSARRWNPAILADDRGGSMRDAAAKLPDEAGRRGHDFSWIRVHSTSGPLVQMKSAVNESSDIYEQEADRIAAWVTGAAPPNPPDQVKNNGPAPIGGRVIQRAAIQHEPSNPPADAASGRSPINAPKPPLGEGVSGRLIVEDDSREIGAGQMRKTEFLNQLERAVCAAADQELARVGRNTQGCPYIERWIGYYRMRSSQYVERALFRYAPEAASATSAREYIPIVAERIKRAVTVWATTGQITGVPEELAGQIGAGGLLGAAAGVLAGIGGAVTGAIGSIGRAIGGIFTKAKDGGPRKEADPEQVQSQFGSGQPLDGGVKQRMESAFGHSFSNVRVHNDAGAAELSESLNARAFTLGEHLAFGAGEYRPGTIVGDALIAHELAHVMQQRGGMGVRGPSGSDESSDFEIDADRSAAGALISMWGGAKGVAGWVSQTAAPRFRSGLRLQRCGGPELASKGKLVHRGTVGEGAAAGAVEVRFGDAVKDSGLKQNLVGLEYTGPYAEKFKWLQFVWMEALAGDVPVKGVILTSGILGSIEATTDRSSPLWKVDASARTSEPFYDSGGLAIRSSAAITMFDKPLESGAESQARDILKQNPDASSATIADHFETYLIRGGQAVYRVQWLARITYEAEDKTKPLKTKGTQYEFLSAQRVEALPETLRKILVIQFPEYNKPIAPGVADGEPKYEGPLVTPEVAEPMTPWELSRLPGTAMRPSIEKKSNLRPEDYSRAAGFIRRLFDRYGVTYDVERQSRILGRLPKPEEQALVNRWLSDVLAVKDVRKSVTGGRGLPVASGSSAPSLAGHVRIFNDVTEFSVKRFQLQRLVAQEFDVELKDVDKRVQSLWTDLGIQPGEGYTITAQERWASSLVAYRALESSTPAFYYPSDDVFYLSLNADLTKPETKALASHETVHLLGGRQKTLDAFAAKFGRPGFIEYWRPFEEGMAERITLESLYPGKENESLAAKTDSQYKDFVELVETMMAGGKREAVFQAYFTGNIPDFIFDFLRERVAKKPGAQKSGGESGSKKESEKGAASK